MFELILKRRCWHGLKVQGQGLVVRGQEQEQPTGTGSPGSSRTRTFLQDNSTGIQ